MSTFNIRDFNEDRDTFLNAITSHDSLLFGLELLKIHALAEYEVVAEAHTKLLQIFKNKLNKVYTGEEPFEFNVAYVDFALEDLYAITPPSVVRALRSPEVDIQAQILENAEKRLPGAKTTSEVADIAVTSIYRDAVVIQLGLAAGSLDATVRVIQHYYAMYNNEKLTTIDKEILLSQLHQIVYNSIRDLNVVALGIDLEYLERKVH